MCSQTLPISLLRPAILPSVLCALEHILTSLTCCRAGEGEAQGPPQVCLHRGRLPRLPQGVLFVCLLMHCAHQRGCLHGVPVSAAPPGRGSKPKFNRPRNKVQQAGGDSAWAWCVGAQSASCRRGDQCPFSHGVFESWLHPSRYRTQASHLQLRVRCT